MVSLYDYLGRAAGSELGKQVATAAAKAGVKGETIPNFIPIESANVNGEVVSNERFMPTHVKEMLEGIFNQEAIPMIPSFDIKYAYIKDGDEVIRVEVYLTDEEKKQLQTFRDVGGLDFETNQQDRCSSKD